jgi:hypothetical protein
MNPFPEGANWLPVGLICFQHFYFGSYSLGPHNGTIDLLNQKMSTSQKFSCKTLGKYLALISLLQKLN